MKVVSLFVFFGFTFLLTAQDLEFNNSFYNNNDCPNWNSFLSGNYPEGIMAIADGISDGGMIVLNPNKWFELGGASQITNIIELSTDYSFELVHESAIRGTVYSRYQEFFQGVPVEDGGFTVASFVGDPDDDCLSSYLLALNILTGLEQIDTIPSIKEHEIKGILESVRFSESQFPNVKPISNYAITESSLAAELVIRTGFENSCSSKLVWKSIYSQEGAKQSWVDAQTGQVLWVEDAYYNIEAPVSLPEYADASLSDPENGIYKVLLDDTTVETVENGITVRTTSLVSTDGRIKTYNFNSFKPEGGDYDSYTEDRIPTTTNMEWSSTDASSRVFQVHFVMQEILPLFDQININFGTVNTAFSWLETTFAFVTSSTGSAFMVFGSYEGEFSGLYDIAAHELGHCHLLDYMPNGPGNIGEGTLHEAIADMFAVYIESEIQNEVDWIIGDDISEIGEEIDRDLSQITQTTVTQEVLNMTDIYDRGDPLRHLFYLLAEGQLGNPQIPVLGVRKALELILDGVYMLGAGAPDYDLLQEATVMQAQMKYEECSDELKALEAAWEAIGLGFNTACYTLIGSREVCSEDNTFSLCIGGGSANETYYWNFPIDWTVAGNPEGNRVAGQCLTVLNIPDYSYYPQIFNLRVWSENSGAPQFVRVTLEDCNGDNDDCNNALLAILQEDPSRSSFETQNPFAKTRDSGSIDIAYIRVFDILGRELYSGSSKMFDKRFYSQQYGLLLIASFSKDDEMISLEKHLTAF